MTHIDTQRRIQAGSMMRRLCAVLLFALYTVCAAAGTKQYAVTDVPNVRLHDASQYVSDPAHILSPAACDTINAVLARLEKSTGIESAVVMLPSIGNGDIFDFAHNLFRTWGIGKKKSNNGLLILFVMDQRKVRFTTGYGIEGTMTDAMARRIQTEAMVPRFKNGDWDGGMVDGVKAAANVLNGSMQHDNNSDSDDEEGDDIWSIFGVMAIVVVTVFFIIIIGEQQRCPKCRKKGAMQKVDSQILRIKPAGGGRSYRIRRTTYICKHCGHIVKKDERIDNDGTAAMATGMAIGSMLGGRSGGGGSFGGTFGGGSTGGGGATSGW